MESPIVASEDTSSALTPHPGFNIAAAFPVTDEITRRTARARWRRRLAGLASTPGIFLCIAAGVVGVLLGSRTCR